MIGAAIMVDGRPTFIRWSRLGVWERLLMLAQERRVQRGMTFLDGTSVRAHQKAAGAAKKTALVRSAAQVKRLTTRVAAVAMIGAADHRLPRGTSA
ncbi:MAG: hypothetical protein ACJ8H8_29710 [Geminicoccaceae bacterium]